MAQRPASRWLYSSTARRVGELRLRLERRIARVQHSTQTEATAATTTACRHLSTFSHKHQIFHCRHLLDGGSASFSTTASKTKGGFDNKGISRKHVQHSTSNNSSNNKDRSYQAAWMEMTERILAMPIGSFQSSDWASAKETCLHWYKAGPHVSAVRMNFKLLDRISQERRHQNASNDGVSNQPPLPQDLFNGMLNHWQVWYKQRPRSAASSSSSSSSSSINRRQSHTITASPKQTPNNDIPSPTELLRKVEDEYSFLGVSNLRSYTMILDAMTYQPDYSAQVAAQADAFVERLIQNESAPQHLRPDPILISTLMHAWAKAGDLQQAERWLARIDELRRMQPETYKDRLQNTSGAYTLLITQYSMAGKFDKVQTLFRKSLALSDSSHDVEFYNSVLLGFTRIPSHNKKDAWTAAEQAHSLLQQINEMYKAGKLAQAPTASSYAFVLSCWSRCCGVSSSDRGNYSALMASDSDRDQKMAKEASQRAITLLRQLQTCYVQSQDEGQRPNTVVYNAVLAALARSGQPKLAEDIFGEMIADFEAGNNAAKPDSWTFSTLISGWSKHHPIKTTNAIKAQDLMKNMSRFALPITSKQISPLLHIWAQLSTPKNPKAAQQAEDLLQFFEDESKKGGDPKAAPDRISYSIVMNAWGRVGRPFQVQNVLDKMLVASIRPTTEVFTPLLLAWKNSKHPRTPEMVQSLLQRMEEMHGNEGINCRPNLVTYGIVISCWATAKMQEFPNAAKNAHQLLDQIRTDESIRQRVKPNARMYSDVIHGYSRVGDAASAQKLLYELIDEWEASGRSPPLKPTTHVLANAILAWANSTAHDRAEKAEELLVDWQSQFGLEVNIYCYAALLSCWAKSMKVGCGERAEGILRMMDELPNASPNMVAYNTTMNAWANDAWLTNTQSSQQGMLEERGTLDDVHVSQSGDHILDRVERLFREVKRPDQYTYLALLKTLLHSSVSNHEKVLRCIVLEDEMKLSGYNPANVIKKKIDEIKRLEMR